MLRKPKHLLVETFGNDVLVFDTIRNVPHIINDLAHYILNRMDGKTSEEEIAQDVCNAYAVDYQKALSDIRALEEILRGKGLVHE
jgi:methyltransferase-like protein